MIEQWQDQAAIESHNQQPLLQKLFQHMPDYAAQKRAFSHLIRRRKDVYVNFDFSSPCCT